MDLNSPDTYICINTFNQRLSRPACTEKRHSEILVREKHFRPPKLGARSPPLVKCARKSDPPGPHYTSIHNRCHHIHLLAQPLSYILDYNTGHAVCCEILADYSNASVPWAYCGC